METIGIYPKDDGKPYLGRIHTMVLFVFLKYLFMYHGLQGKEERKQRDQEATTVG